MGKKSLPVFILFAVFTITVLFETAIATELPFTIKTGLFDQTKPDNLGLSLANGTETVTVFRPSSSTDKYSNGVVMTGFKGWLYCQWQSSAQDEDSQDTWVAYSRSKDGKIWTKPTKLVSPLTNGYCTSGGWLVADDTLVAYINVWPSNVSPKGGYTYYTTSTDGLTWTKLQPIKMEDGSFMNGVIEQDTHATPSGRIISAAHFQPGLIASPIYTDDPSGIQGWVRASLPNLTYTGNTSRELEPSWFLRNDGADVMVFRDQTNTYHRLASISFDNGKSWSTPVLTDMPDSRAKQSAGNLPDGTAFMVGNPVENKTRIPLTVTLSKDGKNFDKAYVLRQGGKNLQTQQYTGKSKTLGYNYPKSMVWQDYLYVAYATNKEDVEYTRIPLSSLSLNSTTSPTVLNGTYIKSLVVNDTSNSIDWSIQSNLQVGDIVYGDRTNKFTVVPSKFLGTEWIRTACDSKAYTSNLASFTTKSDVSVYVGVDARVTNTPTWLSSWTNTGEVLTNDTDVTFNLYKKNFSANSNVVLGTNVSLSGALNYTVIVVPNTVPAFIYGDVNGDNVVNAIDYAVMKKYLLGTTTSMPSTDWQKVGDLNSDGVINAIDYAQLKRYLLGSITKLPV